MAHDCGRKLASHDICFILGLPPQLSKLNPRFTRNPNNFTILPFDSAQNLGVISDENLSSAQRISSVSIATFITHSKID